MLFVKFTENFFVFKQLAAYTRDVRVNISIRRSPMIRTLIVSTMVWGAPLLAQTSSLQGSDTLAGFMSDVIIASGLESQVVYQGGGSGKGEEAIVAGLQGIAPMSRQAKPEALKKAADAGINLVEHVIGLDGVGVFKNSANPVSTLTIEQVKGIYTCQYTNWSQVGGADQAIVAYRRNDSSGTTDIFKTLVGIKEFGACVQVVAETTDIAAYTATQAGAVGYAGLSAGREGNEALSLSKDASSKAYLPLPATIRTFQYPLSRRLYIYEASGRVQPTAAERSLLNNVLDRSFADPILLDNEFFTLD